MRLATIASALAIIICVAVVGVILSQSTSIAVPASAPKVVAPAARPPGPVITEIPAAPAAAAVNPADQAAGAAAPAPNAPMTVAQAPRAPAPAAVPPPPPPHVAAPAQTTCPGNPDALGVARTVEIDTTGGPGFGFEHFKSHDFLREGEVVLTFDDGPWPKNTVA